MLIQEKDTFKQIVELSEMTFDDLMEDNVVRKLFNLKGDVDLKDAESLSTVTVNKINQFYVDLNGELKQKGKNRWGLMSGVTKYSTHSMFNNDTEKTEMSKMFGIAGRRDREVWSYLTETV